MTKDRVSALVFLAFSIAYGVLATEIPVPPFVSAEPFTPRTLPLALSALGILLALAMLFTAPSPRRLAQAAAREGAAQGSAKDLPEEAETPPPAAVKFEWGKVLVLSLLMSAYGFTLKPLGFILATSLFLIGGYLVLGERRPWLLAAASLPLVVLFWALLTQVLGIYLDPGDLFAWLLSQVSGS